MQVLYEQRTSEPVRLRVMRQTSRGVGRSVDRRVSRPAIELRNHHLGVSTLSCQGEDNMKRYVKRESRFDAPESETLCMDRSFLRGNRETSLVPCGDHSPMGRSDKAGCHTADMHATEESDDLVVPSKRANKAETSVAESVEERGSTKGTVNQMTSSRTRSRNRRGFVWLATACNVAWATDRYSQGRSRMR